MSNVNTTLPPLAQTNAQAPNTTNAVYGAPGAVAAPKRASTAGARGLASRGRSLSRSRRSRRFVETRKSQLRHTLQCASARTCPGSSLILQALHHGTLSVKST